MKHTGFRWNDWKTIRKARRAKRLAAAELARRKREIGARAIVGYARRHQDGAEYLMELGYGKKARESWPTFV